MSPDDVLQISVDPGINTGLAVWLNGMPILTHCIKAKGKGAARMLYIESELHKFCLDATGGKIDRFNAAAVERAHKWTPKHRMQAMVTHIQFQAIALRYFLVHGVPTMEIQRDAKAERDERNRILSGKLGANAVCLALKVDEINEHARDAVYVGFLAGFYA